MSKINIKYNKANIKRTEQAIEEALFIAGDKLLTDLKSSGTMPFDVGTLQNNSTFLKRNKKSVSIISSAKYARRLYFHPDYNYQKTNNSKAGGMWFEPYISGNKKSLFKTFFEKALGRGL